MEARNRTRVWRVLMLLALAGVLVLAWTQRDRFTPVDVGSRAPEFAARTLNGEHFSVQAARGKVIVLNVWATWCTPCRQEMPALERLHEALHTSGLEVVGVSTDAGPGVAGPFGQRGGDVRAFVQELGLTFRIIHDAQRTIEPLYLVPGLPTTFVIEKQGRIDKKVLGARKWDSDENIAYFRRLLSE